MEYETPKLEILPDDETFESDMRLYLKWLEMEGINEDFERSKVWEDFLNRNAIIFGAVPSLYDRHKMLPAYQIKESFIRKVALRVRKIVHEGRRMSDVQNEKW